MKIELLKINTKFIHAVIFSANADTKKKFFCLKMLSFSVFKSKSMSLFNFVYGNYEYLPIKKENICDIHKKTAHIEIFGFKKKWICKTNTGKK